MAGGYLMMASTVFFSAEGCAGDRGALSLSSLKRTPMSCNAFGSVLHELWVAFLQLLVDLGLVQDLVQHRLDHLGNGVHPTGTDQCLTGEAAPVGNRTNPAAAAGQATGVCLCAGCGGFGCVGDELCGDGVEFDVVVLGESGDEGEGVVGVDVEAFHHDAFGLADDVPIR